MAITFEDTCRAVLDIIEIPHLDESRVKADLLPRNQCIKARKKLQSNRLGNHNDPHNIEQVKYPHQTKKEKYTPLTYKELQVPHNNINRDKFVVILQHVTHGVYKV